MKYLKRFESKQISNMYFTKSDMDEIMDIFQDLIDEYDIIDVREDEYDNTIQYLINYIDDNNQKRYGIGSIDHHNRLKKCTIRIYFYSVSGQLNDYPKKNKLLSDIESFTKRLNSIGYKVESNIKMGVDYDSKSIIDYVDVNIFKKN